MRDMEIQGKIAIVTGASEGIGLATAKLLAKEGARVVLVSRSEEKLAMAAREIPGALAIPADMRQPEDIKRIAEETLRRFGRIDILVNNAGQGLYGPLEKVNIDQYKEVMELNVYGALRAMQEVIPAMRRQGGGVIVNVSSMTSKMHLPGLGAYASTKYALNALALTARDELAAEHIVVSLIYPRMTSTRFGLNAVGARSDARATGQAAPNIDSPEEVAQKIAELIRSGEAEAQM